MTITLPWWTLPIAFLIVGFVLAWRFGRSQSDYDMLSPILALFFSAAGIVGAAAFLLGRWLA